MSKGVYTVEKIVGDKGVSVNLTIHDKGFYTKQGWTTSQDNYLWKDVSELSVEGPDALQKRITSEHNWPRGTAEHPHHQNCFKIWGKYTIPTSELLQDERERKTNPTISTISLAAAARCRDTMSSM